MGCEAGRHANLWQPSDWGDFQTPDSGCVECDIPPDGYTLQQVAEAIARDRGE